MEITIAILVILTIYVLSGIKVVNQYQRGVVLTLGKFTGVREPGLKNSHANFSDNDNGRYALNTN
ncbi:hypothetical protein [Candidatus Minimicrobia naudis]